MEIYNRDKRSIWYLGRGAKECNLKGVLSDAALEIINDVFCNNERQQYLDLSSNRGIGDSNIQEVCKWIDILGTKIEALDLSLNDHLTSKGASMLFKHLRNNQSIERLFITENRFCDKCLPDLISMLNTNKKLYVANMGSKLSKWDDNSVKYLSENLMGNTNLKHINITRNEKLPSSTVLSYWRLIEQNRLESINMDDLSKKQLKPLRFPLIKNIILNKSAKLDLRAMNLNDEDIMRLADLLLDFEDSVIYLNLFHNKVTSKGAIELIKSLHNQRQLKKINLERNDIDDEIIEPLINLLKSNSNIEKLNISDCKITDAGFIKFCEAFHGNQTLKVLKFLNNSGITNESSEAFENLLKNSTIQNVSCDEFTHWISKTLPIYLGVNVVKGNAKTLKLVNKFVDDKILSEICDVIDASENNFIENINKNSVELNEITSIGAAKLFKLLLRTKSVKVLILSLNKLDDSCMNSLAKILEDNNTIKQLDIGWNKISNKGLEIICNSLLGNTSLSTFEFSGNEKITDESFPILQLLIQRSAVQISYVSSTGMSEENQQQIMDQSKLSLHKREIPIQSASKSAAKRMKD